MPCDATQATGGASKSSGRPTSRQLRPAETWGSTTTPRPSSSARRLSHRMIPARRSSRATSRSPVTTSDAPESSGWVPMKHARSTPTRWPFSWTARSSSGSTTTRRSTSKRLDVRPGLAAYSRASYLRELHGDVEGARQAFAQAGAAGSDRYDLASVAVLRGKLALGQSDLDAADAHFAQARDYVDDPAG